MVVLTTFVAVDVRPINSLNFSNLSADKCCYYAYRFCMIVARASVTIAVADIGFDGIGTTLVANELVTFARVVTVAIFALFFVT